MQRALRLELVFTCTKDCPVALPDRYTIGNGLLLLTMKEREHGCGTDRGGSSGDPAATEHGNTEFRECFSDAGPDMLNDNGIHGELRDEVEDPRSRSIRLRITRPPVHATEFPVRDVEAVHIREHDGACRAKCAGDSPMRADHEQDAPHSHGDSDDE